MRSRDARPRTPGGTDVASTLLGVSGQRSSRGKAVSADHTTAEQGRCGAKTRTGTNCKLPAGHGTDHVGIGRCKRHGGSTRNHVKHAQHIQATQAVETYGLPRQVDPHAALLEELHRTAGHVAWLSLQVQALDTDGLHGPVGGSQHGHPREEPHVWVRLYQEERRHLADVAKTCVAVGIEERRVAIAEEQGRLLAAVIQGVLADLGVSNHPEAPAVVRRHLTLVAGS